MASFVRELVSPSLAAGGIPAGKDHLLSAPRICGPGESGRGLVNKIHYSAVRVRNNCGCHSRGPDCRSTVNSECLASSSGGLPALSQRYPGQRRRKPAVQFIVRRTDVKVKAQAEGGEGEGLIPQKQQEKLLREFPDLDEKDLEDVFLDLQLESDVITPTERAHYEIIFLIHEDSYDEVPLVKKKVQAFVEEKRGIIWRENDWGLRRLAYRIRKARKANYILMNVELPRPAVAEFENLLLADPRVIRHLVMRQKKAITEDMPPPPMYNSTQLADQDAELAKYDDSDKEEGDEDEDDGEEWEEVEDEEEEQETTTRASSDQRLQSKVEVG